MCPLVSSDRAAHRSWSCRVKAAVAQISGFYPGLVVQCYIFAPKLSVDASLRVGMFPQVVQMEGH